MPLQMALTKLEGIAEHLNEAKRQREQTTIVHYLNSRISGLPFVSCELVPIYRVTNCNALNFPQCTTQSVLVHSCMFDVFPTEADRLPEETTETGYSDQTGRVLPYLVWLLWYIFLVLCTVGKGSQSDQKEEDVVVVLQYGIVCVSTLQEQEKRCFISVSS